MDFHSQAFRISLNRAEPCVCASVSELLVCALGASREDYNLFSVGVGNDP